MMERNIKLSIVMPVFNNKEQVKVMIDSLLANDYKAWQLLAVDDGSEADTLDLLDNYAAADDRIIVLKRNRLPKGAQTCRNMGLERAETEFVVFFDSDDYVTPSCLGTRVCALEERPDLDFMVFPSGVYIDERFSQDVLPQVYGYKVSEDDVALFAERLLPFIVWNNIYRTLPLKEKHLEWDVNLKSLQDSDYNMQAILAGLKYDYYKGHPDYGYRISYSQSSISANIVKKNHFDSHLYSMDKFYKSVYARFGHRYDDSLYTGVQFLFLRMFPQSIDWGEAKKIVQMLSKYNSSQSRLLSIQMSIIRFFSVILPYSSARQIAMARYLVKRKKLQKRRNLTIRQQISNISKIQ